MGKLTHYDVFLNHRGPDLKKTFVSHLDAALRRACREPFLDAKSLVKGQHAFNSINKALTGVFVHVAIFSPRYAESKYCLNELCYMLESQKPLIPVFYDVEPENLRCTEVGPFAKAVRKHLKRGRDEDVMRWKAALSEVAAITGFRLVDSGNDAAKLVKRVVAAVLDTLPASLPLAPACHLVGLKESITHVTNTLHKMGNNVGVMGICGMGGIGKTTLAREVYNQLSQSSFDSWCFLKDVKKAKGFAVMDLQMKMVNDLLQLEVKKMHSDYARWFDQIQMLKIFLVIDDVDERKQFDELIPSLKQLAPGSRVLITSRERDVLNSITMDFAQHVYHVAELSHSKSQDLFTWCAFRTKNIDVVDASFHKFVTEIANACCGLPLALEVMGRFLADKKNLPEDEKYWHEATLALRKNGEIMTNLQVSYDGLVNNEDKCMFLDIACFMLGHPEEVAVEVWDSIGDFGSSCWALRRLIDKCLIKVDAEGRLSVHDLLRDMGRNVVLQRALYKPEMQTHIWDCSIAAKMLQKNQDANEVLALSVVGLKTGIACKAEQYGRMKELRYIFLDGCPVNGDFSGWSEELRWLQWRYFPLQELPWSLKLPNLAVLDLAHSSCLINVWARNFDLKFPCKELRILILTNCIRLMELPQHINKLLKLKFVNLEGCWSLKSLPDSLGELTDLEYLNLSGCKNLTSLPDSFVNLLKLKELFMKRCKRLRKLPMEFGRLKSIEVFKASSVALEELPVTFGLLPSLKEAHFGHCRWLEALCHNFGSLGKLSKLNLGWCKSLTKLPDSFSNLSNLEELELSWCELLRMLPPSFSGLKKLRVLRMLGTALEEFPEDFGQLQSLTDADFDSCRELLSLAGNFGCLRNLQKINFSGCVSLTKLSNSFSDLSNLQELDLSHCYSLQKLPPSICGIENVRTLSMAESALWELPEDFGLLQSLEEADFSGCHRLQNLGESFGCLASLRKLNLKGCESLTKLPKSFTNLSNLETLNLSHCRLLQMLPVSLSWLKKLATLELYYMTWDRVPEGFSQLPCEPKIEIVGLEKLRDLCPPGQLQDYFAAKVSELKVS